MVLFLYLNLRYSFSFKYSL